MAGGVSGPLLVSFAVPNTYQANGIVNKIGACFDVGESGVSQANRRISNKLKNDKKLKKNSSS